MTAITKTTVGLNLLRDSWSGAQNPKITYVALGSSSTAPTVNDTQLNAETFRKKVTSYTQGATGEELINLYLSPTDAVGLDIEEVGFFAGASASGTRNSGVLVAHGLYSHANKLSTESIQIQFDGIIS